MRKRALLITGYFIPPYDLIPSRRSGIIARALTRAQIPFDVLTITPPPSIPIDNETCALEDAGIKARVFRTRPLFLHFLPGYALSGAEAQPPRWRAAAEVLIRRILQLSLWPDGFAGWRGSALRWARQCAPALPYAVIISDSFPYTSHQIAEDLHNTHGTPWIMSLRDSWAISETEQYTEIIPCKWQRALHQRFMQRAVSKASRVWNLVPGFNQRFREAFRDLVPPERFRYIPFGADFETAETATPTQRTDRRFQLTYTGSFRQNIYPFDGFLQALSLLRRRRPELPLQLVVRVHTWPSKRAAGIAACRQHRVEDLFDFQPVLHEKKLFQTLKSSDALLIIGGSQPWSRQRLSSKLFDYIAVRRTILALVHPDSAIATVMDEGRLGTHVPPDNPDAIANVLESCLDTHSAHSTLTSTHDHDLLMRRYSLQYAVYPAMAADVQLFLESGQHT